MAARSHGWQSMHWAFLVAIHTLCIDYSSTTKTCLPRFPLEFQDQKDGDRKMVTLSGKYGTELTITPVGSGDRLSTILIMPA